MEKREKIVCRTGDVFEHKSGGKYVCVAEDLSPNNAPTLQNVSSGWTFQAHGVGRYDNNTIDWDYSTGGQFDEERLSEYLREHHSVGVLESVAESKEKDIITPALFDTDNPQNSIDFCVIEYGDKRIAISGYVDEENISYIPSFEEYVDSLEADEDMGVNVDVNVEYYNIGNGESIDASDEQIELINQNLDEVISNNNCVLLDSNVIEYHRFDDYDDYENEEDRGY